MSLPALVADGGEMTVLRHVASHVYGAWDVRWPEGFTPPELDPDHELGFVHQLRDDVPRRTGDDETGPLRGAADVLADTLVTARPRGVLALRPLDGDSHHLPAFPALRRTTSPA